MDVQVKHNSADITSHVISYEREHKICTGIGQLEMEVDYTYSNSFDPWDEILIFENGQRAGQYYVGTASEGQPNSTITVSGQDNSKRLSDYFIAESYLIDYPSYNRFWIEYFLTQMGIQYTFLTGDYGTLLSNNTALGLMSGYEQITQLVQLSGWYFTFDYNGTMIIGKALADFGRRRGSYNNRDIIDIQSIKSDRMLRNRVVVWGKGDPEFNRWVFADVSKPTKWDYDSKDKRTIVISNSNIRKTVDAFMLANKALLEFSTITVEKHITLEGAENLMVGDVVSVRNKVFTGAGKVTTFGTSMSRSGLTTNLILDERCPRLFGFFDIGGWVYVGTFGSGVWRKHILPAWSGSGGLIGFASGVFEASGWYDYSSGLMDMNVTDLHVNAGVLVSITSSGEAWYSLEDEHPWSGIQMSGLTVTQSGLPITMSNGLVDSTVYSGLMARACIIDRDTNFMRVVVDTRSGINYGDFLMETDPINVPYAAAGYTNPMSGFILPSGIPASGMRSWVMDVNAYSGEVMGTYPINVSGNYNYWAFDIENDGTHDYVEAMTIGSGDLPTSLGVGFYNSDYSAHGSFVVFPEETDSFGTTDNNTLNTIIPYSGIPFPELQNHPSSTLTFSNSRGGFYLEDYTPGGSAYIAASELSSTFLKVVARKISLDSGANIVAVPYGKVTEYLYSNTYPLATTRLNPTTFRYFFRYRTGVTEIGEDLLIIDYDLYFDTITSRVVTKVIPKIGDSPAVGGDTSASLNTAVIGTTLYSATAFDNDDGGFDYWIYKTELMTQTTTKMKVISTKSHPSFPFTDGSWKYSQPQAIILVCGNDIEVIGRYLYSRAIQPGELYKYKVYRFHRKGFSGATNNQVIFDRTPDSETIAAPSTVHLLSIFGGNFNRDKVFANYLVDTTLSSQVDEIFDYGDSFTDSRDGVIPENGNDTHYNFRNRTNEGFSRTSSFVFKIVNPDIANATVHTIVPPAGYTLYGYAGIDSLNGDILLRATNTLTSVNEIIAVNYADQITRRLTPKGPLGDFENVIGNFRVHVNGITWVRPPTIRLTFPIYTLLQRDGFNYTVVKSGFYRERIDISNYSPIVTMDRRVSSLQTYYISTDNSVLATSNVAMSGFAMSGVAMSGGLFQLGIVSDDFRYSTFDESTIESGSSNQLYVVFNGQIGSIDLSTFSGMSGIFTTNSGYVSRVEISNYEFPDQYTFASLSGFNSSGVVIVPEIVLVDEIATEDVSQAWGFLQKDPISGVWVDYSSGYPQARTTIIRLDDRI